MKKQILELQNYFIQKIQKKEYNLLKSEFSSEKWLAVDIVIDDEYLLQFSFKDSMLCVHQSPVFFCPEQKEIIRGSFEYLMTDAKNDSIRKLRETLSELEAS